MQLLRGDAPAAAARGNTAPQPGTAAPAAAGSCRVQLRDKAAQVACGSPSSLPVPFATAQEPGSPSEPPAKHQRPGRGAERPPCSECLCAAGSVPERCCACPAPEARLLTFLRCFSLAQGRLLSAGKLERLIEELQKADPEQGPAMAPSDQGGRLGRCPAAGSSGSGSSGTMRGRWLPWPFALRRGAAGAARAPGQEGSGCSRALFGQPLAAVCAENGTLPRPIQELLAVLQQQGPTTEGIFCKVESARAIQELRQALDRGLPVDMASQPVLLLAVVLKHFLRSIPGKLLVTDLYEDWMAAMQMASREDKISQLKAVAKKLPTANLLLLQQLLAVLRCIGQHASSSRVTCSSLAICLGPRLLSPPQEEQLELQVLLAENDKSHAGKSKVGLQAEQTRSPRQKAVLMHLPH
ncbi:T-cell activation Rho GTPase-activating protein-like isoform X4 [Corvus hawaiiensis]|uniref:T-cell activation Rho GTPase-activating protein-like isoform X4 n=1 Tax=Corvus hawaiiensis TaxID=134902 RepID=UPI002019E73D|nr:T-cell activation Rho GTPase-activating protein-like isoform X4 [Corvus hawaiiensis]